MNEKVIKIGMIINNTTDFEKKEKMDAISKKNIFKGNPFYLPRKAKISGQPIYEDNIVNLNYLIVCP